MSTDETNDIDTPAEETTATATPESEAAVDTATAVEASPVEVVGEETSPEEAPKPHVLPKGEVLGTGRRKSSVARIRMQTGSGNITVNGKSLEEYFPNLQDQNCVVAPLKDTEYFGKVDVRIRVNGGGNTGQSGACRMGLGRALYQYDPNTYPALKENGHLTRDSRMKERKKPGLHGARRGTQFSKR